MIFGSHHDLRRSFKLDDVRYTLLLLILLPDPNHDASFPAQLTSAIGKHPLSHLKSKWWPERPHNNENQRCDGIAIACNHLQHCLGITTDRLPLLLRYRSVNHCQYPVSGLKPAVRILLGLIVFSRISAVDDLTDHQSRRLAVAARCVQRRLVIQCNPHSLALLTVESDLHLKHWSTCGIRVNSWNLITRVFNDHGPVFVEQFRTGERPSTLSELHSNSSVGESTNNFSDLASGDVFVAAHPFYLHAILERLRWVTHIVRDGDQFPHGE
mmetsp:Transcript_35317/g.77351  ORF Transcript_35317/g.77351 Transcript_35317/m.77351 type:complete len:269 (-) Transcript_35317:682-1488(-)